MESIASSPINLVHDPRITHHYTRLNGLNYHYAIAKPLSPNFTPKTHKWILLLHGWPDLWAGWRYQIPPLLSLGLNVILPDLCGYGDTDSPDGPNNLYRYSLKSTIDDMILLLSKLGIHQIIVGGHDWGGLLAYRFAQYYPHIVTHLFSVCTTYSRPRKNYISLNDLVRSSAGKSLAYQIDLAESHVEQSINTKQDIRNFLNGIYGGRKLYGRPLISPSHGVNIDHLNQILQTPLMTDEELTYYVEKYSQNGLRGPFNWYRTHHINWQDEQKILNAKISVPALFIVAEKDIIFTQKMIQNTVNSIPNLHIKRIQCGHWALIEKPDQVNSCITQWFHTVVFAKPPHERTSSL